MASFLPPLNEGESIALNFYGKPELFTGCGDKVCRQGGGGGEPVCQSITEIIDRHIDAAVLVFDIKDSGKFDVSYANNKFERIFDICADDVVGKSFQDMSEVLSRDFYVQIANQVSSCVSIGSTVNARLKINQSDVEKYFRFSAFPIKNNKYRVLRVVVFMCDVTKEFEFEENYNSGKESFYNLIGNSILPVVIISLEKVLYANSALSQLVGTPMDTLLQMTGKEFSRFLHPEDRGAVFARFHARMQGKPVESQYGVRFRRADGEFGWAEILAQRIHFEGKPASLLLITDNTEKKETEEKLKEQERVQRALLDAVGDVLALIDLKGNLYVANETCKRNLEIDSEKFNVFDKFPPSLRKSRKEKISQVAKTKSPMVFIDRRGGKMLENRIFPMIDDQNRVTKVAVCARDITNILATEKRLRNALAENNNLRKQLESDNSYLHEEIRSVIQLGEIDSVNRSMRAVIEPAEEVAATDSCVLICGETGTGKELLARAIHRKSARAKRPMITVNCAAFPSTLIESELFGYEKGAFTGAVKSHAGRFELADGSTLFLDEIAELPVEAQSKLLRVLEGGTFERLGGTKQISVDVRIIAATNRDLHDMIASGTFRSDLYYRLCVYPITIPPLRDRKDDIDNLIRFFVKKFGESMGKKIDRIPKDDIEQLKDYDWPGNVRELRNVIERSVISSKGSILRVTMPTNGKAFSSPDAVTLEEVNRRHIRAVLEKVQWRVRGKGGAAEILGLNPSTLESKMKKLSIERPEPIDLF